MADTATNQPQEQNAQQNEEVLIQTLKQQDAEYNKQYKFKYYKDEIVSVLQLFEKSKEWADLIKCLKRLNTIIVKYKAFSTIPEKLLVCKRLAQCLNPQLPSGVHLKVLETYDIIFQQIGSDRLAVDISIYSSGLFSFLPHASLQAKPLVLDLLERYQATLSVNALIPCISGFQMAILSALEEESTDISNRAKSILDKLLTKFMAHHSSIFFSNLWKIILLTPQSRVSAFNYLSFLFKKFQTDSVELQVIFANDVPLVVAAIVSSLSNDEDSVLVQRAALELLCTQITFDRHLLPAKVYMILLKHALLLLCKKDLSINRRIYQWIFGNSAAEFHEKFFAEHVLSLLVDTLRDMLETDFQNTSCLIVIVLLLQNDFPITIQSQICNSIIAQVLYYLHRHFNGKNSELVIDSFLSLFPMLEPKTMVWDSLIHMLKDSNVLSHQHDGSNHFELVDLIGSVFSIMYSEQLKPEVLITLEEGLLDFLSLRIQSANPDPHIVEASLLLCINIYTKIPENAASTQDIYSKAEDVFLFFVEKIMLSGEAVASQFNDIFKTACTFMSILLLPERDQSHHGIPRFVESVFTCCLKHDDSHVVVFTIETFLGILTKECGVDYRIQQNIIKNAHGFTHLEQIVFKLWDLLRPESAIIHFEVVKLLVEIHGLNQHLCNTMISEFMLDSSLEKRIDSHQKFALIWRLIDDLGIDTRVFDAGLFLMLDSIKSDDSNLRLVGRSWLIASFRNIYRVLDPLFQTLIDQEYLTRFESQRNDSSNAISNRSSMHDASLKLRSPYDFERCKYVLNIWNAMLQVAPRNFIQRTMELKLTTDIQNHFIKYMAKNFYLSEQEYPSSLFTFERKDYYSLIVTTCVQFMECGISFEQKKHHTINEKTTLEESIRTKSIMLLRDLLVNGKIFKRTTDFAAALVECVLSHLRNSVEAMDAVFQVELLGMLHTLLSHLHSCSISSSAITDNAVLLDSTASPVLVLVHSPNFLPTLLQGVSVASEAQINQSYYSYALLNYWIDYISSFLPFLETALPFVITSLVPHLCGIIRDNAVAGIDSLRSQAIQKLLEGLKKMLSFCVLEYTKILHYSNQEDKVDEADQSTSVISTAVMPFRLITDLVKDVFTQEEAVVKPSALSPATEAQQFMLSELPNIIETMSIVWRALRIPYSQETKEIQRKSISSLGLVQYGSLHTKYAIEQSIVHFIDPLMENYKSQLVASLVLLWGNLHPEVQSRIEYEPHDLDNYIIDILNSVDSAAPETVMNSIVDVIVSLRQYRGLSKQPAASSNNLSTDDQDPDNPQITGRKRSISSTIITYSDLTGKSSKLREQIALSFLHVYLRKCILTNKAQEIVNKLLKLIREYLYLPNASPTPLQSLDLVVISGLIKALYSFLVRWNMPTDDKKLKGRLTEAFHKLVEAGLNCCVREMNTRKALYAKATKSSKLGTAEREHLTRKELHDPLDPSIQFLELLSTHITEFMDKIPHEYTPTSNLMAIMLPPVMAILKNNNLINIPRLYRTVVLLSKFNASMLNMRTLRKELWDLFNLPAFFKVQYETIEAWRNVFHTLINGGETIENSQVTTDEDVLLFEQQQYIQRENKALFNDLLNRFSATQSIFTSKDSEALQRSNLLKRLAFILYVGEMDDYYSFLPSIVEKMVDSLKLNPSPVSNNILVTNTLFCLRVLITRISPSNLAPIWPMVTTELTKLFNNLENNNYQTSGGDTVVILEALKFIDFATVVLPQEFHLFKWMYIRQLADENQPKYIQIFEPYVARLLQNFEPKQSTKSLSQQTQGEQTVHLRRPLNTEYLTSDWQDIQNYAYQLSREHREQELYYNLAMQGCDIEYMNRLFALDFQELIPEDIMRLQSVNFDPKALEKAESWIVVTKKDKTTTPPATPDETLPEQPQQPSDQSTQQPEQQQEQQEESSTISPPQTEFTMN